MIFRKLNLSRATRGRRMRFLTLPCLLTILAVATISLAEEPKTAAESPPVTTTELAEKVGRLVRRLDDDRAAERDAAENQLLELAGASIRESDEFLKVLPAPTDEMPIAVRDALDRIRRTVEERAAKGAVEATRVTLQESGITLAEAIKAIETQTGNKLQDQEGAAGASSSFDLDIDDEPFWSAIDKLLDAAGRSVYNYGGENSLALVRRPQGEGARFGKADYVGPFRFELIEIQAQRSLRMPENAALRLQLEIAWEPRLRPIAISQPAADLKAIASSGQQLAVSQPQAVLDVEVPNGTQATELILPFALPERDVAEIASLEGRMTALVPGRIATFRFADVSKAIGKSERQGGVQVTVDEVRKNNAIWEIHMRLRLDESNQALESHRGWVFQNLSYLVDKDGEHIDNAGFETTRQAPNEVGVAYLFDLPDGIEGLTWVYETPASIIELPVKFKLREIELP